VDSSRSSLALVNISHVEADFQRKSELIQTKTAVLNDKERELRLLEQQLVSRERALSWQERQLDVNNGPKHAAACVNGHWQRSEDTDGQQAEKYHRGHLNTQHDHTQSVMDNHQHVHPPGSGVEASSASTGWAMEKLEEQFARLAQTRTTDVGRTQMCVRGSAEVQPRPQTVTYHPADHHLNTVSHLNGPSQVFSEITRKRGRPKGSKNRYMKMPAEQALAVGGLPVHDQLMRLYTKGQMLPNNPVMALAAKEAVRRRMAQQMMINCGPQGRAGMMADSCRNRMKMFAGGQLVPDEQLRASYAGPRLSSAQPPPAMLLTRGPVQSTAVIPARVQQLLASAAFTTGASILPPLSPVRTTEFNTLVADAAHVPQYSFQHGRTGGDHNGRKDVAYRVIVDSAVAGGPRDTKPEQVMFINRDVRFPEVHQQHLSDQALSNSVMANECDVGNCDMAVVQSRRERSYILPKVSSTDTDHCWTAAHLGQEEDLHREKQIRNHMTAVHDDDDDDDEKPLVVVIDGD